MCLYTLYIIPIATTSTNNERHKASPIYADATVANKVKASSNIVSPIVSYIIRKSIVLMYWITIGLLIHKDTCMATYSVHVPVGHSCSNLSSSVTSSKTCSFRDPSR